MLDLLNHKEVKPNGNREKITIKGESRNVDVYQIPLDLLYYNDKNDRIATYISQYKDENKEIDLTDKEKYNDLMHKFLTDSNETAMKNTKAHIKEFGQQRPGIVLNDGRIIDGNRRFTCLREILREGQDSYYEAIILSDKQGFQDKDIKRLELNYQHGEDAKIDYDPIDALVGIYKSIEETKYFSVEEYARETNQRVSTVRTSLETAKLMVEFLNLFTGGDKYYIARDLKMDGPLREISRILKKYRDDDPRKDKLKMTLFTLLITTSEGDKTRLIRDFGNMFSKNNKMENGKMLVNMEPTVEKVYNTANKTISQNEGPLTAATLIGKIKSEGKESILKNNSYVDNEIFNSKINEARRVPKLEVEKAISSIKSISGDLVSGLSQLELKELNQDIFKLEEEIMKLKRVITNA